MKIFGLKQPIPKHIYEQAKDADLGRPDFYVGPTVTTKPRPANVAAGADDRDLETRMTETKKAAEEKASSNDSHSIVSLFARVFQRHPSKRTRPAP